MINWLNQENKCNLIIEKLNLSVFKCFSQAISYVRVRVCSCGCERDSSTEMVVVVAKSTHKICKGQTLTLAYNLFMAFATRLCFPFLEGIYQCIPAHSHMLYRSFCLEIAKKVLSNADSIISFNLSGPIFHNICI